MRKEEILFTVGSGVHQLRAALSPLMTSLILEDQSRAFYHSAKRLFVELGELLEEARAAYEHRNDPEHENDAERLLEELKLFGSKLDIFADEVLAQEPFCDSIRIQENVRHLKTSLDNIFLDRNQSNNSAL